VSVHDECRYLEEAIDEPDLRYYLEKWHPANVAKLTPPARHACPKCSAHDAVQPAGSRDAGSYEAMMDVELVAAMAPGVATVVWGTAGRSPDPITTQVLPLLLLLLLLLLTTTTLRYLLALPSSLFFPTCSRD
jgi:hypothetical protein